MRITYMEIHFIILPCVYKVSKKKWQFILGMAPIIRKKNSLPEYEHSIID